MALHTTTPVEAIEASSTGALAGFESRCESCGLVIRSSLRSIVVADVWEHVAYVAARDAGPKALRAFNRGDRSVGLR